MQSYEQTINLSKDTKTISAQITALGKVKAKTEDTTLVKHLDEAIKELQSMYLKSGNLKSLPICLDKSTDQKIKTLINYCTQHVSTKKPEWQVLAERNGWASK